MGRYRTQLLAAITMILVASSAPAFADAIHRNPDQHPRTLGMTTFGPTSIPVGYYDYCERRPARCRLKADDRAVELTTATWRTMVSVNRRVNRAVRPVTDIDLFGVTEFWDYPGEAGDCEDYVLEKRRQLHEGGFPLGSLLITVAHDEYGGGHAVLTVVTDKGDFVLDNVEKRVLPWQKAELHYLKRQARSDPNAWVDLSADGGRRLDETYASVR